jgi:hypothetical protein
MTPEEISKFANKPTFTYNRTVLKMNNGTEIVGFFEGNDLESETTNNWKFVKTPINEDDKFSTINGNDIADIEIIDLRD